MSESLSNIQAGGAADGGAAKESTGSYNSIPPHNISAQSEPSSKLKTKDELKQFRLDNLRRGREAKRMKKAGVVPEKPVLEKAPKKSAQNIASPKKEEVKEKPKPQIQFDLSVKQGEALQSAAKFLLYGGAKGGGKSWFLCVWMFLAAIKYKGNKLFFCRRRSVDFTNTTLETWRKSIPAQYYRVNEQKKKIYILPTRSVIDYGGLDDPLLIQSLNSAEYAYIGIDQAEEIEQDSFSMLRGTLRHRLPDGSCPKYKIRLTANPAQCWLKDFFILNPEPETQYIPALPTDNPHLPEDYVENLRQAFKNRPHLLAAYLHGSWDDLSGNDTCIRGTWIEEAKKKTVRGQVSKRIIVNDPAITGDENVCFLMEKAGNVYYKADELIIEHRRPLETAAFLSAYRKRTQAQIIAVDCIGIGQGVVDGLNQLEEPILSINSCSKPTSQHNQVKYANLRSQMWWEAAEKFANNNVSLPADDFELARQLGAVKFDPSGIGKLYVQDKAEIKKNLGRSPDRADAFIMGIYALDYVNSLDHQEYQEASIDRVGHGILIESHEEDLYVGVGDDFSGYNF
ncbi:phage terminase large subunit [Candidatus Parcubacteria bacterium]|nr:phage terminase large subunit [Candidatus Parcubacteria bacterium]